MKLRVDAILPNPEQPRKLFSQSELKELAESIRVNTLLNAIAVEDAGAGVYFIIDGERRWRAHKLLGWSEIEATVHPAQNGGSQERLVKAMVANIHRSDLSPIEEGQAFRRLSDLGMSYTTIAHRAGVSLPKVMGRLKLLNLAPEVQDLVNAGKLPTDPRACDALLSISKTEDQVKMALRLARPGIRILTIQQACAHYNAVLQKPAEKLGIPAVDVARLKRKTPKTSLPAWTILQQLKRLPKWSEVQLAANTTCRTCSLSDFASDTTCRDCPAVELIKTLMGAADESR